jgi:HEAT repeat protein
MDDHVQRLVDVLNGNDGMGRKRARETLVLAGETAAPPLRALLGSKNKQTRWEAIKALAAIGDPADLETFLALLDDPNSDLRWLAATGLIQLGCRSVRPVLRALTDPSAPRGRLEMSRRVLGELLSDNQVLSDITAPLMQVIGGNDQTVISERAARALSDLDRVIGRPPAPETAQPTS